MDDLIIEGTEVTPAISFEYSQNRLTLEGRSLPEDVREFYFPVFAWLEEYVKVSNGPVTVSFRLDYFNTASAKIIVDLLFTLKEILNRGIPVEAIWYYEEYDEDMQEVGLRFAEITSMDIKLKAL